MAIDFGSMGSTPASTPTPAPAPAPVQEVAAPAAGVTLNLNKGDMLNITKSNPGLTRI